MADLKSLDVLPLQKLYDVADLLKAPKPESNWLVKDLMPSGYILMLFSPEGVGKSVLAYNLSISVATGTKFLGLETRAGSVLYMDEENPDSYMRDIAERMLIGRNLTTDSLGGRFITGRFALLGKQPSEWSPLLEQSVEILKPTLLVFDTLSSLLPFRENIENDAALMKGLLRYVRAAKDRSPDTTVLVLHHPSKSRGNRPRGAGSIGQDVDGYWALGYPRGRPKKGIDHQQPTILKPHKSRCLAGIPLYRIVPISPHGGYDLKGELLLEGEE